MKARCAGCRSGRCASLTSPSSSSTWSGRARPMAKSTFDWQAVDVASMLAALGISAAHEGDRWVATCPSGQHADAHPSWDVKDDPGTRKHGLHKCLACGFGGTAVDLVSHVMGFASVGSSIAWLEEHAMGKKP